MDSSALSWLSETGLDNPIFTDKFDFMDSFDEELAAILGGDFESRLSPGKDSSSSSSSSSPTLINIPSTNYSTFSTIQGLSTPDRTTPIILNFGNANSPENIPHQHANPKPLNPDEEGVVVSEILRSQSSLADPEEISTRSQNMKRTTRIRPPSQTYDHIIAERKRREQLSQRFVVLSTIVPGLKKMDKTSVLGDAIKYLKYLQERVKILEEQATKKKSMESVVLVKKSQIMVEDADENNQSFEKQPLPEIEARICNTQMLIRIHTENQKGLLTNLISEVEKLNLTIVNTNVASFARLALEITIVTEMEKEFNLTVNEVVKKLHAAIQRTL